MTRCTDSCCRPYQDGEEWRIIGRRQPVARKPYPCGDCGVTINAGERHYVTVAVGDGLSVVRSHSPNGECSFYVTEEVQRP